MTLRAKDTEIGQISVNLMTVVAWFATVVPVIVGIIMYTNVQFTQIEKDATALERKMTAEISEVKMSITGLDKVIITIEKQATNQTEMLVRLGEMAEQIKNLQVGILALKDQHDKR